MTEMFEYAVSQVIKAEASFCRYITVNDIGNNNSHQCGFYVSKEAAHILFESPGIPGENKDKFVKINWQDAFETDSRFIYYGKGTRNEYRITRFSRGFPFLTESYTGSLLILCRMSTDYYVGIVLEHDDDIDGFFSYFNLPVNKTNNIINKNNNVNESSNLQYESLIQQIINSLTDFPTTEVMSNLASDLFNNFERVDVSTIVRNPDKILLEWVNTEYELFGKLEEKLYQDVYSNPFDSCQAIIDFSNKILNRRKSRAGKSLEHHLEKIFTVSSLRFSAQQITEDNKKPDFIFPSIDDYHNLNFPTERLTFLGVKTTCKDRWRQVLNEADRISHKYLFTLQKGISSNQLIEMEHENLTLVVPESHKNSFDPGHRGSILSLKEFMFLAKERQ